MKPGILLFLFFSFFSFTHAQSDLSSDAPRMDELLSDPDFLEVLQRHLSDLHQVKTASEMAPSNQLVRLVSHVEQMANRKPRAGKHRPDINQAAYRQACEVLLNDPEFLDELLTYFGHLERLMAQQIHQPDAPVALSSSALDAMPLDEAIAEVHKDMAEKLTAPTVPAPAPDLPETDLAIGPPAPAPAQTVVTPAAPRTETLQEKGGSSHPPVVVHTATPAPAPVRIVGHIDYRYYLQLGYFRNARYAERMVSRLQDRYPQHAISMKMEEVKGEWLHRVTMGQFADRASAKSFGQEIRAQGYKYFVMRS